MNSLISVARYSSLFPSRSSTLRLRRAEIPLGRVWGREGGGEGEGERVRRGEGRREEGGGGRGREGGRERRGKRGRGEEGRRGGRG